jgi:DNA-binding transcriptional regulator YdaS (Cro superfamily)
MTDADIAWKEAQMRAGGPDALAALIGIKRRTLFLWKQRGVPAERVQDVARVTGIPAATLRPDLARAFEAA